MGIAEQAASMLTTNTTISQLDLNYFSGMFDRGEGAVLLAGLSGSPSLPTITHFRCGLNDGWFKDDKESSNGELLCNSIRAMTSLKYLNVAGSMFSTEATCDKVLSAIMAN